MYLIYTCNRTNGKGFLLHTSGISKDGKEVFLRDIWPTREELQVSIACDIYFHNAHFPEIWEGILLLVDVSIF